MLPIIKTSCVDLDLPLLTWGDNWVAHYTDERRPAHFGKGNTEQDAIADLIKRFQPEIQQITAE